MKCRISLLRSCPLKQTLLAPALVVLTTLLTACLDDGSPLSCEQTADCRVGEVCRSGECVDRNEPIPPSEPRDGGTTDDPPPEEPDSGHFDTSDTTSADTANDGGTPKDTSSDTTTDVRDNSADSSPGDTGGSDATSQTLYPDCDSDGFGTDAPDAPRCENPAMADNAKDCHDGNAAIPVTGPAAYHTQPYTTPSGGESFDYNCDNNEESQYQQLGQCAAMSTPEGTECFASNLGWLSNPPACGDSGQFVEPGDCEQPTVGGKCKTLTGSSRVQPCR